jgi:hypothetical protein
MPRSRTKRRKQRSQVQTIKGPVERSGFFVFVVWCFIVIASEAKQSTFSFAAKSTFSFAATWIASLRSQ